jgi:hypothetical protein
MIKYQYRTIDKNIRKSFCDDIFRAIFFCMKKNGFLARPRFNILQGGNNFTSSR